MDEEIVRREQRSIPEIFQQQGEAYFRNLETGLLKELQKETNKIISCGGGAALRAENVAEMKKNGKVILLTAEPQTILNRVKYDNSRPNFKKSQNRCGYCRIDGKTPGKISGCC